MGRSNDNAVTRLLLTGDLHLGRSSSRVRDNVRKDERRAATAWSRIVDLAIREQVAAVCLSGDVADEDNKFWEAIGPLERGVRRLGEAGIRTLAVAGNHDYDVLARLADQLPPEHFVLLGRGGKWERHTIHVRDRAALHLDGWSFPSRRVHQSPLKDYGLARDPAVPILGMVHGELDVATTPYAPLELARLQALTPSGWLLGHIHAPGLIEGPPWVLYPGSPQALDPGERGAHGPWIVEVSGGTLGLPEQRPLSSVWYGECTIDLSGVENETELESAILGRIRREADRISAEAGPHLCHASLRLRLIGTTSLSRRADEIARRVTNDLALPAGAGSVGVEAIAVETLPSIDLDEYARTHSAPGEVARLLLELDRPDVSNEVADLIRQARSALERIERHKDFAQLERREVTEQMAREQLRTQGRALLTRLVAQTA
jgi:DNA repair exonuclease SbcCD nuclease subunit